MAQKDELIITIHATPTEMGKYMWIVEEQRQAYKFCTPDWRLLAKGFADSPFEAYKTAMFEVNKHKEKQNNESI